MLRTHAFGELSFAVLDRLKRGPATAHDIAAHAGVSVYRAGTTLGRLRKRGFVAVVAGHTRSYFGHGPRMQWQLVEGAPLQRITRMVRTPRPEPALPPEVPVRPSEPYRPAIVHVGGIEYQSYSGRVPLSAYAGASSLVGTARWGCA